ncbi:uncharacterized protein LOC142633065 [Castanea sativa]|uniref:uncharacterized protein LOC142633065 n=1 Tax=Castanea sativa TaxID=21020 RepID=UPI003F650E7F
MENSGCVAILRLKDCQPLIDKIQGGIKSWSLRKLSFAGKCFCTLKIPQERTWSWRAILKLRDEVRKFIRFEVGDGKSIFLWHDLWHPAGVLIQRFGSRVIYDVASNPEAKVDFVLNDKPWIWRLARSDALVSIQCQLFIVELKDEHKALWQVTKSGKFSYAATYVEIRDKSSEAKWWKLIWFHLTIPKHSFIEIALKVEIISSLNVLSLEEFGMT